MSLLDFRSSCSQPTYRTDLVEIDVGVVCVLMFSAFHPVKTISTVSGQDMPARLGRLDGASRVVLDDVKAALLLWALIYMSNKTE